MRPFRLFLLSVLSLALFVGCGDSRDEYVFTGTAVTITGIDVQPATATVQVGGTQRFEVVAQLSDGTTLTASQFNNQIVWSSTANATIDQNGEATGVAPGTATITADVTTPNGNFSDTAILNIGNQNPTVTVDSTSLNYSRNTAAVDLFPNAAVTDEQDDLSGGTLTISVDGDSTGINLEAPATPDIGAVTDGTDTITVALDDGATPANVQAFLRGVQLSSDGTAMLGSNSVTVTLTDGNGGTATATRDINVQGENAQSVTVAPSGADFTSIQAAIDSVAAEAGGQGSVITVAAGDYTGEGDIDIINDPDLENLVLQGANAGVSAGTSPGTRGTESVVNAFNIDSPGVVIDGFQINGVGSTSGNDAGVYFESNASNGVVRNNVIDGTDVAGSRGVLKEIGQNPSGLLIERNLIRDFISGTYLDGGAVLPSTDHVVRNNQFLSNQVGNGNDNIQDTQFLDNVYGTPDSGNESIGISNAGTGIMINGNDFNLSTNQVNLYTTLTTVDAENNWWGQASGPQAGQANVVSGTGSIDTDPFLAGDPFPALP